jgi:hypothetical protein
VRSHAGASAAESSEGGSVAGRGGHESTGGQIAFLLGIASAISALLVLAAPASATKVHLFAETFGSAAQPAFGNAQGLAIDQSTGDILVMDAGSPPSFKRYNPDGTPADFSALGTNVIDGIGNGECATVPADCDQTPQNGLGFASPYESQIAVDNSATATDGNIYVTQSSPNAINVFSEEGEYLGQLTESSGGGFSEACGVAVDSAGAVYVGDYSGGIHKFVPAANPPVNGDNTANFTSVSVPCALAAGAGSTAGALFAAQYSGPISKIDSSSGELKYTVSSGFYTTVSVDPSTGQVFGATGSAVDQFDASAGTEATMVASVEVGEAVRGVAVRASTGKLYLSRGSNPNLTVYGPTVAVPTVTTGSASDVQPTSATLTGEINPDGYSVEECKFEYGPTASFGQSVPCVQSPGSLGSGTSNVTVSAALSGLQAGTVYHYRLVASNENGLVNGSDATVQTAGPAITDVWTDSVTRTEAILKAGINPEGAATTYRIEWGPDATYGSSTPERSVGDDSSVHLVFARLAGLAPNATYHWRVVASNSAATNLGPDRTFTTYPPLTPDTSCPNQAFRVGFSADLADCRAYEMVSPVEKNGADIKTVCQINCFRTAMNQASDSGDKLTYSSYRSFGDALSSRYSNQYIASRGSAGWTTHSINPPIGPTVFSPNFSTLWDTEVQYKGISEDLSKAWLTDDSATPPGSGGVEGQLNLLERHSDDSFVAFAHQEKDNFELGGLMVQGYSPDGSHVVFRVNRPATSDAAATTNGQLYEFSGGEVKLVSVLPGEAANPGSSNLGYVISDNGRESLVDRAISDDGSHIYWTNDDGLGPGAIYVRVDGTETVPVASGIAQFWAGSADGSTAIYQTDKVLYKFDLATKTSTQIASGVYGFVRSSDDNSYVYFLSNEVLAPGATAGERNLYVDHEGDKTLIATLTPSDNGEGPGWSGSLDKYRITADESINRWTRVTPDGTRLVFQSPARLTDYDNTYTPNGEPAVEIYRYDAQSDELACVSCNPSNARPQAQPLQMPFRGIDRPFANEDGPLRLWTAAWLITAERDTYSPRSLSADGNRIFFNAFDALVPQDTNGEQDVYQWEAEGKGGCTQPGGCISLISSGRSPEPSEFVDADPTGRDVFFSTKSSLSSADPGLIDIYDAREGGGFPLPPPPPVPCNGDACQNIPPAPQSPTPASASFRGVGDPGPRRACGVRARRAAKLRRRATQLMNRSDDGRGDQAKVLRDRAARLVKRASVLDRTASRCRRAGRRAER